MNTPKYQGDVKRGADLHYSSQCHDHLQHFGNWGKTSSRTVVFLLVNYKSEVKSKKINENHEISFY